MMARIPVPASPDVPCPKSSPLASNSNHDNPFQYSKCAESVLKRIEPGGQSDGLSAVVPVFEEGKQIMLSPAPAIKKLNYILKDFNLRNVVWISMILISAGSVYGMMSQKVSALETKMDRLEQILFQDIPEIKEQLVRLDAKISYLVEDKEAN